MAQYFCNVTHLQQVEFSNKYCSCRMGMVHLLHQLQEVQLGDGDPVTAMHASLDGFMLAVQRSSAFVQFVHIRSSKMFVQVTRP